MKKLTDKNNELITRWDNLDHVWRTMVHDHRSFLLAGATTFIISDGEQQRYMYRISDYLKSKGKDAGLTWIIIWLNQIGSTKNFVNVAELLVPDSNRLQELYKKYTTAVKLEKNLH